MTTLTEHDLKELKDFIIEQFQEVSRQFTETNAGIDQLSQEMDEKIDKLSQEMDEKIDKLSQEMDEKIDKLSQEMDEKIDKLSKEINGKIDKLSEEVTSLRVDLATLQGEFTGINKRLDNLDFTNRTIFVAIITALMTGIIKLFFPNNP